jgi:hypothetical protein
LPPPPLQELHRRNRNHHDQDRTTITTATITATVVATATATTIATTLANATYTDTAVVHRRIYFYGCTEIIFYWREVGESFPLPAILWIVRSR